MWHLYPYCRAVCWWRFCQLCPFVGSLEGLVGLAVQHHRYVSCGLRLPLPQQAIPPAARALQGLLPGDPLPPGQQTFRRPAHVLRTLQVANRPHGQEVAPEDCRKHDSDLRCEKGLLPAWKTHLESGRGPPGLSRGSALHHPAQADGLQGGGVHLQRRPVCRHGAEVQPGARL